MADEWTGGHLNDGAWWWGTALDGIVGGIIGGLFTAFAVVLTIRHERLAQVRANVRDSASALIVSSVLLPAKVRNSTIDDSEAVQEVLARSIDLMSKLTGKWPSVAVELQQRVDHLLEVWSAAQKTDMTFGTPPVSTAVSEIVIVANNWVMANPKPDRQRARKAAQGRATAWVR
ncbi:MULTISPECIES: hypothetical protein [unclassified Nocardioides]|uniref:hypothetical protein n=1 Tax=unclassified Nocardioides TaxID=2615069 RepID=UPI0012E3B383|nr:MULTISPECIES: hypothetical protein [unclassified Nocardioides]